MANHFIDGELNGDPETRERRRTPDPQTKHIDQWSLDSTPRCHWYRIQTNTRGYTKRQIYDKVVTENHPLAKWGMDFILSITSNKNVPPTVQQPPHPYSKI